jgi:EAL domain-containing protein (putative c-di-GMP-specific phosphodiesterase class I)
MHMVRAGAIGYVIKGAPREQIISALERARKGEASLSGQVASLVVNELSAHLRDQEREAERRRQDLAAVRQLAGGEGLAVRFEPVIDLVLDQLAGVEAVPWRPAEAGARDGLESWVSTATSVGFGAELEVAVARFCLARVDDVPAGAWVGINVAPSTLLDPGFLEDLEKGGPATVCLEIGDQSTTDYEELRRALERIRGPRLTIAVDGIGSSGAALRLLSELRPDIAKLDPWVMERQRRDGSGLALVETMARLVTDLGSQLVVCGVRDPAEMHALSGLGVRFAQGRSLAPGFMNATTGPQPGPEDPPLAIAQ